MLRYFYWLFLFFSLSACGNANIQNNISDVAFRMQTGSRNHYTNQYAHSPNIYTSFDEEFLETDARIERIKKKISKIDGIDDVIVSLTNNNAVVGISLNKELNDRNLIELKNEVELKTKAVDKNLNFIAVTTAPELVSRLTHSDTNNADDNGLSPYADKTIEKLIPIVGV